MCYNDFWYHISTIFESWIWNIYINLNNFYKITLTVFVTAIVVPLQPAEQKFYTPDVTTYGKNNFFCVFKYYVGNVV